MGKMRVMDGSGDSVVTWELDKVDQVQAAQTQFEALVRRGFTPFAVRPDGNDEIVERFDPKEDNLVMVPRIVGG